jgi:hypothetical protein
VLFGIDVELELSHCGKKRDRVLRIFGPKRVEVAGG